MSGNKWRIVLPLGYMLIIYLLSSLPGDQTDLLPGQVLGWLSPQWQNLLHVPLYAGLTACWLWTLGCTGPGYRQRWVLALMLTALWAVADEFHQSFVPGRYGSLTDIALDLLGAVTMLLAALLWKHHTAPRREQTHA